MLPTHLPWLPTYLPLYLPIKPTYLLKISIYLATTYFGYQPMHLPWLPTYLPNTLIKKVGRYPKYPKYVVVLMGRYVDNQGKWVASLCR
jgi:hypothetical protein